MVRNLRSSVTSVYRDLNIHDTYAHTDRQHTVSLLLQELHSFAELKVECKCKGRRSYSCHLYLDTLNQTSHFPNQSDVRRKVQITVNPQNYAGVNLRESAQYSNSTSKTFAVWWLKSKNKMPLILFYTCNFRESWSFAKNMKVKYSQTFVDLRYFEYEWSAQMLLDVLEELAK